jgi:hypothetical protein
MKNRLIVGAAMALAFAASGHASEGIDSAKASAHGIAQAVGGGLVQGISGGGKGISGGGKGISGGGKGISGGGR